MKRLHRAAPFLLSLGLLAGVSAQAQHKAYKCIIDGRTVFQQAACPVNAEPDAAKPDDAASNVAVPAPAKAASATRAKGVSAAGSGPSTAR